MAENEDTTVGEEEVVPDPEALAETEAAVEPEPEPEPGVPPESYVTTHGRGGRKVMTRSDYNKMMEAEKSG
jgi:hypothetical protein